MLVITRKVGERVQIGESVTVTVLEVSGSSVRIGIDAPSEVRVYRHEILEATEAENRAAAAAAAAAKLPGPLGAPAPSATDA